MVFLVERRLLRTNLVELVEVLIVTELGLSSFVSSLAMFLLDRRLFRTISIEDVSISISVGGNADVSSIGSLAAADWPSRESSDISGSSDGVECCWLVDIFSFDRSF